MKKLFLLITAIILVGAGCDDVAFNRTWRVEVTCSASSDDCSEKQVSDKLDELMKQKCVESFDL